MKRLIQVSILFVCIVFGAISSYAGIPTVVSTSPVNGATEVAVTSPISVTFSEVVTWASIGNDTTGNFSIRVYEDATNALFKAYDVAPQADDLSFVLALTSELKSNTTYRVLVSAAIRSVVTDNSMSSDYEFKFTTSTAADSYPPSVVTFLPPSGSTNNPLNSIVTVNFSEPMDPLTMNGTNIFLKDDLNSVIAANLVYDAATNAVILTPMASLSLDRTYSLNITTGVKDIAGNAMASAFVVTPGFKTIISDKISPTILTTTPIDGSTSVTTDTFKISFSEEMDPATVSGLTVTVTGPNSLTTAVAGVVSYDGVSSSAYFTATGGFAFASDFVVTVSTGAKDLAGNALTGKRSFKFTTAKATVAQPMLNYCQIPAFVAGSGVKPNVLMVLDDSISMKYPADANAYSPTKRYYGLFDSGKMYSYSNAGWTATADTPVYTTVLSGASKLTSGNFLNWLLTSRLDALKMVMVGAVKENSNSRSHYEGQDTRTVSYGGVSFTVKTASNKLVFTSKVGSTTSSNYSTDVVISNAERDANPGLIRLFRDKMNMGIMHFGSGGNNNDEGGHVAVNVGQTGEDFITDVLAMTASTYTPLAESLTEAVAYFKGVKGYYSGQNYAAVGADPIKNDCAKNFVVMVTDGEPTYDQNLPGSNWSTTTAVNGAGFSVKDYMQGTTLIKGLEEIESWSPTRWSVELKYNGTIDMNGSWYLPAVAYYAHTTDLRTETKFPSMQNLNIYTVFAFDDSANARTLLKLAAKYGSFDLGNTNAPDTTSKYDKDLDGNPDSYYEASNGSEMVAQLTKAFNDILGKVSSGTAASILNNSEGSGANLLQAVFYPKKAYSNAEVTWVGEVQNLWYHIDPFLKNSTIRIDSNGDSQLDLKQDKIARFYFDSSSQKTMVDVYSDNDGNGVADSATPVGTYEPDNTDSVKSLWRAGKLLWERNLSTNPRTIFTRTGGLADTAGNSHDSSVSGLAKFSNVVESGYASKLTEDTNFQNMLQAANVTEADKIVKYIHGIPETDGSGNMIDIPGYRSRLVKIGTSFGLWRLGDIVSSTPKLLANLPLNTYAAEAPTGYNDSTYSKFTESADYKNRGMVFVGANDGMLHAFKLGTLVELNTGSKKARLDGTGLGQERWAFIPKNTLPYLRYLADPAYSHLFYVDGSTTLVDVSIHAPTDNDAAKFPGCDSTHYWKCGKKTVTDSTTKALDFNKSSWRTVLIGSMGLGGANRNNVGSGYCYASTTGTDCVKTPVDGVGYSSYFALDVTDPENPKFLWEFSGDPTAGASADKKGGNLGFATSGPVIVREGDRSKNGRWFAVFASGPTGPIDTSNSQFMGRSDQPLSFFVVDIATGKLVKTINTLTDGSQIADAFSGSLSNGAIDTDKSNQNSDGFYKDDALYVGYTQKTTATTWYNGGVVRILTNESEYPDINEDTDATALNKPWTASKLIDGIGPVTSAVAKLQDRGNKKLWLYFGTGRYFYKTATGIDDATTGQRLYGVQDQCYNSSSGPTNDIYQSCSVAKLTTTNLKLQDTIGALGASDKGWYINLGAASGTSDAERVITDPVASPSGAVFFTTLQPTSDVCKYGGDSYIWAVNYATGGTPATSAMQGKLLMQVSTGAFAEISMSSAFGAMDGRRLTNAVQGVPPKAQGLSLLTNPKPIKKILHIQER